MKNIIFFDTETTGNTEKDFLCHIAYKEINGQSFCGLYKPPLKIPPEASAVHHISNKMIEDKPSFRQSSDYQTIKNIFGGLHICLQAWLSWQKGFPVWLYLL